MPDRFLGSLIFAVAAAFVSAVLAAIAGIAWYWVLLIYSLTGAVILVVALGAAMVVRRLRRRSDAIALRRRGERGSTDS